jgi:hypothetical protein
MRKFKSLSKEKSNWRILISWRKIDGMAARILKLVMKIGSDYPCQNENIRQLLNFPILRLENPEISNNRCCIRFLSIVEKIHVDEE